MREAELTPNKPTSQPPSGWSPPNWLLKALAKCWWLIVFEVLGLLSVILLIPLAQGFDRYGQNIQGQVAALIALPPTHPYLAMMLAATLPFWAVVSWLAHRRLERQKEAEPFERFANQFTTALQEGLKPLAAAQSISAAAPAALSVASPQPAPVPPFTTHFVNVPSRTPYFTGRDELLQCLHDTLTTNRQAALTQIQAITGLGGIGKTQTALEYAYRYRQEYTEILWLSAETQDTLLTGLMLVAQALDLPERDAHEQEQIVAAVRRWLATHTDWLLVLDNVDNIALVQVVLPLAGQGHLLVTTRSSAVGPLGRPLELDNLPPAEGALLLLRRAKLVDPQADLTQASDEERAMAQELAEILGGLPLALDQAGAYIEEKQCGLAGYQALYATERAALLAQRGRWTTEHLDSVMVTFMLALAQVERIQPAAADLLLLCAWLHPEGIPEELFTLRARALPRRLRSVASNILSWQEALDALRRYSLISRQPEQHTLSMHRLVQAVLQEEGSPARLLGSRQLFQVFRMQKRSISMETKRHKVKRVVRLVNETCPSVELANWERCQRLLSHALACASLIEQEGLAFPEAARLLTQAGTYLYQRAQYAQAQTLLQQALQIREQVRGPIHPDVATSLVNLGMLYKTLGQDTQAEPLYQRALAIYEKKLGPKHVWVATTLNNLGALYRTLGQDAQAEPLYRRALVIYEQRLGPNHSDVANVLHNLALLYHSQKKYEEALPLYQRALAIREQVLGPNHPDVANVLNSLGGFHLDQGQVVQALPFFERALAIRMQTLGLIHPDMASSLHSLAALLVAQGQLQEALALIKELLPIFEQTLGPEHPTVALCLENQALVLHAMQQHTDAAVLELRAQAIRAKDA